MQHAEFSQQIRALFFGEEVPQDFQDVVNEYYRLASNGSKTSARVVSFHHMVTNLHARSKKLIISARNYVTETLDLLQEGEDLAESMREWSEDEDGWHAMRVTSILGTASRGTWIPHKTHAKYYYSSIFVYLHWFRYNLACIKLHDALIDCLRAIQRENAALYQDNICARIAHHQDLARAGTTDFLGGVAFALGDIDERGDCYRGTFSPPGEADSLVSINTSGAQRLILPLYILRHSEHLTDLQSEGIEDALLRIGRELNFPWTYSSRRPTP
jgi:hypothetical protein